MESDSRHDGILLAGENPVLVDLVACLLMGIDPEGIPQVRRAFDIRHYRLVDQPYPAYRDHLMGFVRSNKWPIPNFQYRLPPGWEGHIPHVKVDTRAVRDDAAVS